MFGFLNNLPSLLHSIFAFIAILVPLVVFHEFGHFIFAKLFGVKAEVFSVGFGPSLWKRQVGETEFRLSAIPMGGYVKLLGEDRESSLSPEELKRALHTQKPWKRFFIFFGGPLFNFILAIFIFMVIFVIGEPQLASVVGRVVHQSVAEKAGFRSGDQILEVNGRPVKKYDEVISILNEHPNEQLTFKVVHRGENQPTSLQIQTSSQSGFTLYGEQKNVGEINGLLPLGRSTQVGISSLNSMAGKSGVQTGDQITQVNQQAVASWEELEWLYEKAAAGAAFELSLTRVRTSEKYQVKWVKPQKSVSLGVDLGLYSSELFIEKTVSQSPAEKAGLKSGDRLVQVGNSVANSFFELRQLVQKSGESSGKVVLQWERDGKMFQSEIEPTSTSTRDPVLNKTTQYTIGVMPMLVLAEPVTVVERVYNPIRLTYLATERMVTLTWRNLVSLKKMATGSVSMGTLGGPLMIGKIAGESLSRGWIIFLTNMAIFSIGLGVLNILPIPVLDGGHLLLLGVESIRGKPLTLRQMEIVQSLGLIFILALMGIAFHNDIARLISS